MTGWVIWMFIALILGGCLIGLVWSFYLLLDEWEEMTRH